MSATPVADVDANVLVPAGVRDVFLSIADAGLFVPIWQSEIEDEILRNASRLIAGRQPTLDVVDIAAKVYRAIAQMNAAFPGARLDEADWTVLVDTMTNDPKDRHVLAAAVATQATHLVTENLRDFPRRSVPKSIVVQRAEPTSSVCSRSIVRMWLRPWNGCANDVGTGCGRSMISPSSCQGINGVEVRRSALGRTPLLIS